MQVNIPSILMGNSIAETYSTPNPQTSNSAKSHVNEIANQVFEKENVPSISGLSSQRNKSQQLSSHNQISISKDQLDSRLGGTTASIMALQKEFQDNYNKILQNLEKTKTSEQKFSKIDINSKPHETLSKETMHSNEMHDSSKQIPKERNANSVQTSRKKDPAILPQSKVKSTQTTIQIDKLEKTLTKPHAEKPSKKVATSTENEVVIDLPDFSDTASNTGISSEEDVEFVRIETAKKRKKTNSDAALKEKTSTTLSNSSEKKLSKKQIASVDSDNDSSDNDSIEQHKKKKKSKISGTSNEKVAFRLRNPKPKTKWTEEDDEKLIEGHKVFGNKWRKINREYLNNKFLGRSVAQRYLNVLHPNLKRGHWSHNEEQMLIEGVNQYGTSDFTKIAKKIFNWTRSGNACRLKYFQGLDPDINHDEWTEDEDAQLIHLRDDEHLSWADIARQIPGRNDSQCRQRYRYALNTNLKKGEWSDDEIEKLMKGIQEHGYNFADMSRTIFQGKRSEHQIRSKYTALKTEQARKEEASTSESSSSSDSSSSSESDSESDS